MKRLSITTLILAALAWGFSAQPARAQISVSISIGGFYNELEPYGRWVDCNYRGYGDCWVPARVSRDWQPYSNGEWVYTEYGWTWVSYDAWGDDPYHYGSWVYTNRYRWAWIPGTVWAPAWVTWSYSDNYVGWAPLPPSIVFGSSGYSGRPIRMRPTQYVFVPTNRFIGSNIASVRTAPQQSATIFRQTTPITRFGVSGGIIRNTAIPLETIERATGNRIPRRNIRDAKTAPRPVAEWTRGNRRQVSIVAPAREVRDAIASRPQGRTNRRPEAVQQQAAPRGEVPRRQEPKGRVQKTPRAAPPVQVRKAPPPARAQPAPEVYRGKPETSNAPANRGRKAAPARPAQAAPPPQAAPPAVQAPPGRVQKQQAGRGKPEKAQKGEKGKKEKPGKD
jgi:Family of unknown function (DUF6600)